MLDVKRKPAIHSQASTARSHVAHTATSASAAAAAVAKTPEVVHQPPTVPVTEIREFQAKLPVITGEIHFKGELPVDGVLSGQIGASSSLIVKQRSSASFATHPELNGRITFKNMVRVNGHIAGTIYSKTGTLIVDTSALVEANVDVGVAVVGGTIKGDIIARERVELGPASKIYGNIWTRSLVIKDGAIFEGVCRMIEEIEKAS
ncbi:MAG TPA: polymer-forming cytoskeletal protein [Pyrinomonadaceae bacterium]|nr:polymer-forming cytoskeletal protein [Pyrinomonadaceae bacterium]